MMVLSGEQGAEVLAMAELVLHPRELQLFTKATMGFEPALSMSSFPDTALVFVVLILCFLPVRPYHCQTLEVSELEAPGKLPLRPSFTPLFVHIHP